MVEEILTALSRIRWFFVIARNSSFTYKGQAIDLRQDLGHERAFERLLVDPGPERHKVLELVVEYTSTVTELSTMPGSTLERIGIIRAKVAMSPGPAALRRVAQASRWGQCPILNPPSAMNTMQPQSSPYPRSCANEKGPVLHHIIDKRQRRLGVRAELDIDLVVHMAEPAEWRTRATAVMWSASHDSHSRACPLSPTGRPGVDRDNSIEYLRRSSPMKELLGANCRQTVEIVLPCSTTHAYAARWLRIGPRAGDR
jgi:hypothetical protein